MTTIRRIIVNLVATNSISGRTKPVKAQFNGAGVAVNEADEALPYLPSLAPFAVATTGVLPPAFPAADFETARQLNNTARMAEIQNTYSEGLKAYNTAMGSSSLEARLGASLAGWLKDAEQVETTPGNHWSIDLKTIKLTKNETPAGLTYTLAPAATFGR